MTFQVESYFTYYYHYFYYCFIKESILSLPSNNCDKVKKKRKIEKKEIKSSNKINDIKDLHYNGEMEKFEKNFWNGPQGEENPSDSLKQHRRDIGVNVKSVGIKIRFF